MEEERGGGKRVRGDEVEVEVEVEVVEGGKTPTCLGQHTLEKTMTCHYTITRREIREIH